MIFFEASSIAAKRVGPSAAAGTSASTRSVTSSTATVTNTCDPGAAGSSS
jgi:hypothetical protein